MQILRILSLFFFIFLSINISASQAQEAGFNRGSLGKIKNPNLNEISGMIFNQDGSGIWCHNDSGDQSRFFLINTQGDLIAEYYLEGANFIDVEDIARMNWKGENYLCIADIGDNLAKRELTSLYFVKEPASDNTKRDEKFVIAAEDIFKITLKYSDGPRDAEAIFIDPKTFELVLITKRELNVRAYAVPLMDTNTQTFKKNHILKDFIELPLAFVTAADISRDGSGILVKNLLEVHYFPRKDKEHVLKALQRPSIKQSYFPEPQGEAIAFSLDGSRFYTTSERPLGLEAYIYQYKLIK